MTGFDNMWRDKILNFRPHLTIVGRYGNIHDAEEICRDVEKMDGITGVAASIQTRVLMQCEGRSVAPVVIGIDPDRAGSVSHVPQNITRGSFDLEGERTVVGRDLALQMGADVGSKVLVYSPQNVMSRDELYLPEELIISGIFDMGMQKFDSGFILTSIDVTRELVGMDKGAQSIFVMTEDPFRFIEFAEKVQRKIGPDYRVRSWREEDRLLFAALSNEKTMMFILLVFITIVAIFCVTNTLIVITVQKTNEIGLLKALGFPFVKIMAVFVWLGLIQCIVGIAAGIGTGLLVLNNLKNIVAWLTSLNVEVFPKEIYGLSEIPWDTSFSEIAHVAVFVMIFCTVASLIPALRAARLDPVEALRSE